MQLPRWHLSGQGRYASNVFLDLDIDVWTIIRVVSEALWTSVGHITRGSLALFFKSLNRDGRTSHLSGYQLRWRLGPFRAIAVASTLVKPTSLCLVLAGKDIRAGPLIEVAVVKTRLAHWPCNLRLQFARSLQREFMLLLEQSEFSVLHDFSCLMYILPFLLYFYQLPRFSYSLKLSLMLDLLNFHRLLQLSFSFA